MTGGGRGKAGSVPSRPWQRPELSYLRDLPHVFWVCGAEHGKLRNSPLRTVRGPGGGTIRSRAAFAAFMADARCGRYDPDTQPTPEMPSWKANPSAAWIGVPRTDAIADASHDS